MTIYLTKKLLHSILLISIGMIPFLLKKKVHTHNYTHIFIKYIKINTKLSNVVNSGD